MIGCKTLAKSAGIKGLDTFIDHIGKTVVPFGVYFLCFFPKLYNIGFFGVKFYLDFVKNARILFMVHSVQNIPEMFDFETLFKRFFADTQPVYIPLAHVPDSLGLIDECMDLPFENRFEISLHFSPRTFGYDSQRELSSCFDRINFRTDHFDLSVFDFFTRCHLEPFEGLGLVASELAVHIFLADSFTFKSGTVSDRDRNF